MRLTTTLAIALLATASPRLGLAAASASSIPVTASATARDISPKELRIRVRALIRPVLGTVEESADEIRAATGDPVVRRGALVLKIETTTTFLAALLRSDPVLALADAWAYARQVEGELARPEMRTKFGESASRAAAAMAQVQGQLRDFAASVQGVDAADSLESAVHQWADANPIKGALYRRPAMDSAVAAQLAAAGGRGIFSRLRNVEETAADVTIRSDLYTMYVPRLARWEAELAADDLGRGLDPAALSEDFARLAKAMDRVATVAETAPEMARGIDPQALSIEFTRLARAIDRMATGVQAAPEMAANLERVASAMERLAAVAEEAPALTARERTAAFQALGQERLATLADMERLRRRLVVESEQELDRVVDHAFYRLVVLLVIGAPLVWLGVFLLLRRFVRA